MTSYSKRSIPDAAAANPTDVRRSDSFPLQRLAATSPTAPASSTDSGANTSNIESHPAFASLPSPQPLPNPEQAQHSHAPPSTVATQLQRVEGDSTNASQPQVDDSMSKLDPYLRSSPVFTSPTYGAIHSNPSNADDDRVTSATDTECLPLGEDSLAELSLSRTRSASLSRLGRRSTRQSEELVGSAVLGGVEARFGPADAALPGGLLEDNEDDDDEASDTDLSEDYEVANDQDPPDNSPYPQVRASVAPEDNITLSISTPRMWVLALLFSVLGSSTNLFFSLRYPSVAITPVIALVLVHPLGLLWDYLLKRHDDPPEEFSDGVRSVQPSSRVEATSPPSQPRRRRFERIRLWLAQGRWNEKEHTCVYVSSNVSFGFAFATDVIVEQTQFYKQDAPVAYQLLLTISTQILGYTFAGLTRRFLVRPSGMIWPGSLMSAAMFTTLHKNENKVADGWRISRWRFFYVVWTAAVLFYFLPGLLMPALSYFSVITWFAPKNVVLSNLFGVVSGLGLFPLTFDWAQIAYIGSPLLTPFWAAMNVVGGLVLIMWIIAPVAYYSNWLYSSYMPMLSTAVFDNTGKVYDVSKILTRDFLFDRDAYHRYSRVYLPVTYALSYAVQFAGLASLLTHTICWHGRDIWTQWKRSLDEAREQPKSAYEPLSTSPDEPGAASPDDNPIRRHISMSSAGMENILSREDVHNRLMRRYKDAPMLWYLITFITMTAVGIFVVE